MKKRTLSLHWQIIIAIILGALFGFYFTEQVSYVDWLGTVFMRALKLIVVPLVFCSVVSGVAGISATDGFLRLGGKTLSYYLVTCIIAILIGLFFVNLIKPGEGLTITLPETASIISSSQVSLRDFLVNMVPDNIFQAFSTMNMIGIIIFAILFGVFLGKSVHSYAQKVQHAIEGIGNVVMDLTMFILKLAPYGVFGLIANVVATDANSLEKLKAMLESQGLYMFTVIFGIAFHLFVTLSLILYIAGKINPFKHLSKMKDVLLMAFSTASSNGTLPLTLAHVKSRCGVSEKLANFSLPLGATVNMNGTSLYEGIAVLFIAQVYGMDLSIAQQLFVLLAALMVGIGTAGIPMASLVMTVVIIQMVGLPPESIGFILLVDRFLDMARTVLNVYGDTVCTVLVAKSEGEKLNF
ncbi:MAG: dicarboxylate/amino acid:cation symporter [Bacteroidales bacterium]|nr:dicarboxylate/amino acid:cation symporter [Bacteroidales bacterium]MCL2132806.1 dicarboxylate/amino acid:cation symporter [Bacteroidales bacterium]